jgi:hypothetical protein
MTIRTDSKQGIPEPGLEAAREGRSFCLYVNEKAVGSTEVVLTDSTLLHEVPVGRRTVIRSLHAHLSTDADTMTFDVVRTANADGSGAITVLTGHFYLYTDTTGTAGNNLPAVDVVFDPPLVVTRDEGQAVSVQATGNDAGAALTVHLYGWDEDAI